MKLANAKANYSLNTSNAGANIRMQQSPTSVMTAPAQAHGALLSPFDRLFRFNEQRDASDSSSGAKENDEDADSGARGANASQSRGSLSRMLANDSFALANQLSFNAAPLINSPARNAFAEQSLNVSRSMTNLEASFDANVSLSRSWVFYNYLLNNLTSPSGPAPPAAGAIDANRNRQAEAPPSSESEDYTQQPIASGWLDRHPHKAVCTIEARTSTILTCNDSACDLFAVGRDELVGKRLSTMLSLKRRDVDARSVGESHVVGESGELVEVSGKILESIAADGTRQPVSVWIRRFACASGCCSPTDPPTPSDETSQRCLVIIEPVERIAADLFCSARTGRVLNIDSCLLKLHAFDDADADFDAGRKTLQLTDLYPDIDLTKLAAVLTLTTQSSRSKAKPKVTKLYSTGSTRSRGNFPVCLMLQRSNLDEVQQAIRNSAQLHGRELPASGKLVDEADADALIRCTVCVYANVSGLVTLKADGRIQSCNHYFAALMFGRGGSELVGQSIVELLPDFYSMQADDDDDVGLPLPIESDDEQELTPRVGVAQASATATASASTSTSARKEADLNDTQTLLREAELFLKERLADNDSIPSRTTSTTAPSLPLALAKMPSDGIYSGRGQHKNGHTIKLVYHVKAIRGSGAEVQEDSGKEARPAADVQSQADSSGLFCVWITRDARDPNYLSSLHEQALAAERSQLNAQSPDSAASPPPPVVVVESKAKTPAASSAAPESKLAPEKAEVKVAASQQQQQQQKEKEPAATPKRPPTALEAFEAAYAVSEQIGKGAFSFVKLGRKRSDGRNVVIKFVRKAKVFRDAWLIDETRGDRVPSEVYFLRRLSHPNIVELLDYYELAEHCVLVMPRHGAGMDLFEFIERKPKLDDPLCSYIFRQLVSALSFMHAHSVLHRDVKDENVIIDEAFTLKLIDFGSAAKLEKGRLFATFCGTIEYASPEVLLGNKYAGPELEVWSVGVTLYTLRFAENPFLSIEETIRGVIHPPFKPSKHLGQLLQRMLHPDPQRRATVHEIETHAWTTQTVNLKKYDFKNVLPNYHFIGNTASDNRSDSGDEGKPQKGLPKSAPPKPPGQGQAPRLVPKPPTLQRADGPNLNVTF